MNDLHNHLPKDLVNIVEEYAKDRTKYDHVIWSFKYKKQNVMFSVNNYFLLSQDKIDTELHWSKFFVRLRLVRTGRFFSDEIFFFLTELYKR